MIQGHPHFRKQPYIRYRKSLLNCNAPQSHQSPSVRHLFAQIRILRPAATGFQTSPRSIQFPICACWNPYIVVSWNRGTPKSSIWIGFSIINHPILDTIIYGKLHISQLNSRSWWKSSMSLQSRPWTSASDTPGRGRPHRACGAPLLGSNYFPINGFLKGKIYMNAPYFYCRFPWNQSIVSIMFQARLLLYSLIVPFPLVFQIPGRSIWTYIWTSEPPGCHPKVQSRCLEL